MKIEIKGNILQVSHFSFWALFMWLFIGIIFLPMGITFSQETELGIIFIAVGILSLIGSFLLKKVSGVFDKNTNTVKRCWKSWIGISEKTKSIPLDKIQSIVYEREIAHATTQKKGMKQRFFLFAEFDDETKFYFFPTTYTPLNAEDSGKKIARFLGADFKKNKRELIA